QQDAMRSHQAMTTASASRTKNTITNVMQALYRVSERTDSMGTGVECTRYIMDTGSQAAFAHIGIADEEGSVLCQFGRGERLAAIAGLDIYTKAKDSRRMVTGSVRTEPNGKQVIGFGLWRNGYHIYAMVPVEE